MTIDVIPHRDTITPRSGPSFVTVRCDSTATRANRGRAIAATVRGRGWEAVGIRYSETYGFMHRTEIVYRIPRELGCDKCIDWATRTWGMVTDPETGEILHTRPGYVFVHYTDDEGLYVVLARCYTCNHRDR